MNLNQTRIGRVALLLLHLLLLAFAVVVSVEDYGTGLAGYAMSPSRKMFALTIVLLPGAVQAAQIILWSERARGKSHGLPLRALPRGSGRFLETRITLENQVRAHWLAILQVALLLFDGGYDVIYRTADARTALEYGWSFAEAFLLFTVGSELLLSYSFQQVTTRGASLLAELRVYLWGPPATPRRQAAPVNRAAAPEDAPFADFTPANGRPLPEIPVRKRATS